MNDEPTERIITALNETHQALHRAWVLVGRLEGALNELAQPSTTASRRLLLIRRAQADIRKAGDVEKGK